MCNEKLRAKKEFRDSGQRANEAQGIKWANQTYRIVTLMRIETKRETKTLTLQKLKYNKTNPEPNNKWNDLLTLNSV